MKVFTYVLAWTIFIVATWFVIEHQFLLPLRPAVYFDDYLNEILRDAAPRFVAPAQPTTC